MEDALAEKLKKMAAEDLAKTEVVTMHDSPYGNRMSDQMRKNLEDNVADYAHRNPAPSALDTQVGGGHYLGFAIQPGEFTTRNNLGFLQGCVIKRICRFDREGGGGLQDLRKCIHEIQLLIELWTKEEGG